MAIRLFQGVGFRDDHARGHGVCQFLALPGQEGRYMAVINIAIFCGIGCGPILGGLFSDSWGLASVFYMMAALCFFAFLLVLANMPACCPIDRQQQAGLLVNVRLMLKRRRTVGILVARFATVLMMVPTMAFLPVMMAEWPGSTGLQVGWLLPAAP
jgi:MFS transporter, DHA1 family, multidrug resistance protein